MKIILGKFAGTFALSLLLGLSARADTLFTLTAANIPPGSDTFGWANVHLAANLTDATITFTANTAAGYLFVDGGSVAVNVNAGSWDLSNISFTQQGSNFSAPSFFDDGAGNEDGFGSFNQRISNHGSFDEAVASVTFTVTNTAGTWSDSDGVLVENPLDHTVAAHIAITSLPLDEKNGASNTGFVTDGRAPSVPDGGTTAVLLGLGLVGLSLIARRRKAA